MQYQTDKESVVEEATKLQYAKRGSVLVKNLQKRHFEAYYCENKEQALKKALELIPQGALVADALNLPFVYVRSTPKDHGLENLIEGELRPGMKVVVVEDLISTGGSSLKAVEAIRRDGCEVIGMVAAYTYGFPVAEKAFKEAKVPLVTLTNYEAVMEVALRTGYIEEADIETLNEWRKDPAHWGV